jgi:hypothetical protein
MIRDRSHPGVFLTGVQWRVFEKLTDDWVLTGDIARVCGYKSNEACKMQLMSLKELGFVECQYNGELRQRWWRRKQP